MIAGSVDDDFRIRAFQALGPDAAEQQSMLAALGYASLDDLMAAAMPDRIRADDGLDLPPAMSETGALEALRALAGRHANFSYMPALSAEPQAVQ